MNQVSQYNKMALANLLNALLFQLRPLRIENTLAIKCKQTHFHDFTRSWRKIIEGEFVMTEIKEDHWSIMKNQELTKIVASNIYY